MVIPKTFSSSEDFETMMLTSILGTFVALREDLISFKQAESYWLSDLTASLFEEFNMSEDCIALVQKGVELKDLEVGSEEYLNALDQLIADAKKLMGSYYTEYDEDTGGVLLN